MSVVPIDEVARTVERRVAVHRQARGIARVALALLVVASLATLANAGLTDQTVDTVGPSPGVIADDAIDRTLDPPIETPAPPPDAGGQAGDSDQVRPESAAPDRLQPATDGSATSVAFGWIIALVIPLTIGALVGTHARFALAGPRVTERRIVAGVWQRHLL